MTTVLFAWGSHCVELSRFCRKGKIETFSVQQNQCIRYRSRIVHRELLERSTDFFQGFVHPYPEPHKTRPAESRVMAGPACSRALYVGVVFCSTPGTHAWKGGKGGVISQGPGEFFEFKDTGLNRFFSVFHYCFQVILELLFYSFVSRRFEAVFYEILADFPGKDIIGIPFNEKGPFVVCKHFFEFVHCRDEGGTDTAPVAIAAENTLQDSSIFYHDIFCGQESETFCTQLFCLFFQKPVVFIIYLHSLYSYDQGQ
ncbi:predicted protein [Methanosarcina acetivorans C2A]|uniref:Uncharacterized protein n=1 Tax=Methanosarcina acetivorans (strain ATCC 35395 / DSM 2834 / JCM 12185 / C2A) TaxID=188937 RepID=Q8TM05_METAC|nr:predicted protein [Methanosarcina acetivorans C2A]